MMLVVCAKPGKRNEHKADDEWQNRERDFRNRIVGTWGPDCEIKNNEDAGQQNRAKDRPIASGKNNSSSEEQNTEQAGTVIKKQSE